MLKVITDKKELLLKADPPVSVLNVLMGEGLSVPSYCGGRGVCGKCVVKVYGDASEPAENEKRALGDKLKENYRLACETVILGDATVEIPPETEIFGVDDFKSDFRPDRPLTGKSDCLAGVCDIGTTTVASYLYKMPEGVLLNKSVNKNSQSVYGADVVSRISYAQKHGVSELSSAINAQIDEIFKGFGAAPDILVLSGNTAMLYAYENLPLESLGSYPFTINNKFGYLRNDSGRVREFKKGGGKFVYLPPAASAFIGPDALLGVLSSGVLEYDNALLIDIGTNCEIIRKKEDGFYALSAAAGPAFEGGEIERGSPSVKGAVNKVYNLGGRLEYGVIGGGEAESICGSGLVDFVSAGLDLGFIDNTGYMESPVYLNKDVYITPLDVRHIETAKAAVFTGIETLCPDIGEIERFFIAGGFGKFLNIQNAVSIGLFPKETVGKSEIVGNASAKGAAMILFNRDNIEKVLNIAKNTTTINLSEDENFQKNFISNMNFDTC